VEPGIPASQLSCELLFVEQVGSDLVIDAVTVAAHGLGKDHLPAGSPVTWWLANPSGPSGGLAADLLRLADEVGARVGTLVWYGKQVLVVSGHDDCVVVLLQPLRMQGRVE
jgi:hypothetical protein